MTQRRGFGSVRFATATNDECCADCAYQWAARATRKWWRLVRVSGRPGRTDPVVGRPVRTPSGLAGGRPAWPDAGRPGRPWPEWCVPGWPVAGLWFTIDPKNDVSQKRPERAASLNSGVFTFWISYVGQAGLWSDWRAGGRPVVGLAGRGRPPAGLVGRWPAWPDAVRRGWTASGVVGSSRPLVCTSLQQQS